MKKLSLALCAVAFALVASTPSRADFSIVRWANKDCKIWHNASNKPWGKGWKVLHWRHHHHYHHTVATWKDARVRLGRLQAHHRCTKP